MKCHHYRHHSKIYIIKLKKILHTRHIPIDPPAFLHIVILFFIINAGMYLFYNVLCQDATLVHHEQKCN
jgi:hypothetical protein